MVGEDEISHVDLLGIWWHHGSLWATMESSPSIVQNVGPKSLTSADRARLVAQSSPTVISSGGTSGNNFDPTTISPDEPTSSDQCVFLRGFRIADRFTWEKMKALIKVTDGTTSNLKHSVPQGTRGYGASPPSESQQPSLSLAGDAFTLTSGLEGIESTIAVRWNEHDGPDELEDEAEFVCQNFGTVSFFFSTYGLLKY